MQAASSRFAALTAPAPLRGHCHQWRTWALL